MFLKLTLWGYGLQSPLKKEKQRKFQALEIDLRKSASVSRKKLKPTIRRQMQDEKIILDTIQEEN